MAKKRYPRPWHKAQVEKVAKKKINGCLKGKAGERELAHFLREHGFEGGRGQQHAGGADSPDVVGLYPGYHLECKRVEAGNLYQWMEQAKRDAGPGVIPVVAHRRNNKDWVAIVPLEVFLKLIHF